MGTLTPTERKGFIQELKELKAALERDNYNRKAGGRTLSDWARNEQKKRIKYVQDLLDKNEMRCHLNGHEREKLFKRIKFLEEKIKPNIVPKNLMRGEKTEGGGRRALDQVVKMDMEFGKKYGTLVREWKELKRRLFPDDPNASNVDLHLRPENE
jgi:hypothetical protein